jgi:hypothetical protein
MTDSAIKRRQRKARKYMEAEAVGFNIIKSEPIKVLNYAAVV